MDECVRVRRRRNSVNNSKDLAVGLKCFILYLKISLVSKDTDPVVNGPDANVFIRINVDQINVSRNLLPFRIHVED